jgi:DedD protein
MERKTKHRILGIIVIIALIILLYPFFQGRREQSTKDNLVTAPPFPAEATQQTQPASPIVTIPTTATPAQPATPDTKTGEPVATANPLPTPAPVNVMLAGHGVNQTPDDAITAPPAPTNAEPVAPPIENPAITQEKPADKKSDVMPVIQDQDNVAPAAPSKPAKKTSKNAKHFIPKKIMNASKAKTKPAAAPAPFDNNGLAKLQASAWVIQLGSFKNKSNALRLVNQLRASGYKAFIQHIQEGSANETTTRVFVGPQAKEANARQMAAQLENSMHLKGFVISYKPLNL